MVFPTQKHPQHHHDHQMLEPQNFEEMIDENELEPNDDDDVPQTPPLVVIPNHSTSREPSFQTNNSRSSSMICPTCKPDPIYGRRDTIFAFSDNYQPKSIHFDNEKKRRNNGIYQQYCPKGVRIGHFLLVLFITQGLIGLLPSFFLMYSSGNDILHRVTNLQAEQTQIYISYEISKILNTSNLVIQQTKFELENGFRPDNLTEWAMYLRYLRTIYVDRTQARSFIFANYLNNSASVLDIDVNPPFIVYLNGSEKLLYYYYIQEDLFENPYQDKYLARVDKFPLLVHERPYYRPFKLGLSTEKRWIDVFLSTRGEPSVSVSFPIYVRENMTESLRLGKSSQSMNLQPCDCKHKDNLFGVVAQIFALKGINAFLNTTFHSYKFISYSFIMKPNGTIIASGRNYGNSSEINDLAQHIYEKGVLQNKTVESLYLKFKGKNVVITHLIDQPGLTWALVIGSVDHDFLKELLSSGMTSVVVFIIIFVAGTLLLFVMVQLFTQPLTNVHKQLSKILSEKSLTRNFETFKLTTAGQLFFDIGEMENGINSLKRGVSAFSKFVSPTIMKKVINDEHYLDVGLTLQNMTILVTSINNFNLLAENVETSNFISVMTSYFESLTTVMEEHRGLIDVINGDRLQVVWNDSSMPIEEHEARACKAAMEALEIVEELNCMWRNEKQIDVNISISMSVSSGNVLYGSTGSEHRLNFTAIGDEVSIGSKLQSLNKYYDSKILISENTYQQVKKAFVCYFADYIVLQGRETPISFYSLESERSVATDLQVKISNDLEMVHGYLCQQNYRSVHDICERVSSLIEPLAGGSRIVFNLLEKAKKKIHK